MRKVIALAATTVAVLCLASPASAFEGGGRKPSEAPLITIGQHYNGQLNNHRDDANFNGREEVAIYRLPPLTTHDVVTVDWHGTPFTHGSDFPVCMVLAQGIDDFNWGSVYDQVNEDNCDAYGPGYGLSGSGTARTQITVQETNANSSYLEFASYANSTSVSELETFPYDFTVEAPLHYLGLSVRPAEHIRANGFVTATATLASGLPAPDGLGFNLAVEWPGGGSATYNAASKGGRVGFRLSLPESAYNEDAIFVMSHGADGTYQETSGKIEAEVIKPKALPPSPCSLAERKVSALKRKYRSFSHSARFARGRARAALRRRAAKTKRKLRAAQHHEKSTCG